MVSWLRANGKILFRGTALLLAGAAAGFGLGLFFAVPAGPGCQESDLTPVPDTGLPPLLRRQPLQAHCRRKSRCRRNGSA